MKNKRFLKFAMRAIILMAPFLFIACEKSTGEIGLGQVVDSKAVLGTKTNIPFVTYNVGYDSLATSKPSQEVAGKYIDPYLGGVEAKFQSHILLSTLSPEFGENPVCDSVVMFLAYNGYYGDTLQPVTFIVNSLGEFFNPDSTYYSNKDFILDREIGRTTTTPRPGTQVYYGGDTLSPALRVYLDSDFFQEKLIDASRLSQQYFTSNDEFIKHLNGIQLSTEDYADGLLYFNVARLASFIRVYYRESTADTVSKEYLMNYGSFSTVNSYSQDNSLGGPDLDNQDTVNGEFTVFSQAMAGTVTQIILPDLKELKDSSWVINRAELVFHVKEGSVGKYPLPSYLLISESKGYKRSLIDDYLPGGLPTDGNLEIGFLREKNYTFNISRLVHRYINTNDTIHPLLLLPESSVSKGWRAVLNGNGNPIKPAEFNIYYTKTKE